MNTGKGMMRKTSALWLLLLAGCAAAQAEAARQPRPVIRHLSTPAEVNDTISIVKVPRASFRIANGPCRTSDPMPTGRFRPLDQPRAAMPTAPLLGPLPYIPNACPVTVGPLAGKSVPAAYPRPPKTGLQQP
jgi:hypothetical protein